MAVVKHIAMNMVRNPNDKHSLKVRKNGPISTRITLKLSSLNNSR